MASTAYDIVILGAGPAGYQAAIHAARRKVSVLVLGKSTKSSAYGALIENFCCVAGTSGTEMLENARIQAEKAGVLRREEVVTDLEAKDHGFHLTLESGDTLQASAMVLAMGISRNKLGVAGEKEYVGRGLSYCVDCDGPLFKNLPVAVVGGESAAGTGALTLMFFSSEVHLICEELQMGTFISEKIKESDIMVHEGRKVVELMGEAELEGVELDDGAHIPVKGLFVELGAKGALGLAGNLGVMMDAENIQYIGVNKKQETNVPGIYAAGDICGPPWQVAKAVGEGCVAGLEAAAYVKKPGKTEQ